MKNKLYDRISNYNILDKMNGLRTHVEYALSKTMQIFAYKKLPPTMPKREIEKMVQLDGFTIVTEVNNNLYGFKAGLGGEPDVYDEPTVANIANPALNYSASLKIGIDCVLMRNDDYNMGLLPILMKYGTLLVEGDITIRNMFILYRGLLNFVANDNNGYESARSYVKSLVDGDISVIHTSEWEGDVKTQEGSHKSGLMTDVIEMYQYVKGLMYADLGININDNRKRAYVNEMELSGNQPEMLPFIENMLACRRKAVDEINAMYGTNIEVDLSSAWRQNGILFLGGFKNEKQESDDQTEGSVRNGGSEDPGEESENTSRTDPEKNIEEEVITEEETGVSEDPEINIEAQKAINGEDVEIDEISED